MTPALRRFCWIALAGLFSGCDPPGAQPPRTDSAAATAEVFFERDGLPGPWSQQGATHEKFDAESRVCLTASREARKGADDPADAAYRRFLDCMEAAHWRRGLPPQPNS